MNIAGEFLSVTADSRGATHVVCTEHPATRRELVAQIGEIEELLIEIEADGDTYSVVIAGQLRSLLSGHRSRLQASFMTTHV